MTRDDAALGRVAYGARWEHMTTAEADEAWNHKTLFDRQEYERAAAAVAAAVEVRYAPLVAAAKLTLTIADQEREKDMARTPLRLCLLFNDIERALDALAATGTRGE